MDNPELIDRYIDELWQLIHRMHKDGISFSTAYDILHEMVKALDIKGYAENWLNEALRSPRNGTKTIEESSYIPK